MKICNYIQVIDFWNLLSADEKSRLIKNICDHLALAHKSIVNRTLENYRNVHPDVKTKMKEFLAIK